MEQSRNSDLGRYEIRTLRPKELGLVWIRCPYPVLSLGLEKMLGEQADVYLGREAPSGGGNPSCVVFCPDGEDVASEVKHLRATVPNSPVLIFGWRVSPELARTAMRAGARGFIHAGMPPAQIVRSVSLATRGELVVPREVINDLVMGDAPATDPSELTARQREILGLVSEGWTNAQIGQRLFLSESTIKQHLRAAYKALGVENRTQAARIMRATPGE